MYKNTIPYELNLQRPEELKKREEVVTNIPRVSLVLDFYGLELNSLTFGLGIPIKIAFFFQFL